MIPVESVVGKRGGTRVRTSVAASVPDAWEVGAFYTCPQTAVYMARWIAESGARTVLEPSFGDGVFLRAVRQVAGAEVRLVGAELVPATFEQTVASGAITSADAHLGDFLAWTPPTVDAVIGNPPYVRLRHLDREAATRALRVTEDLLGRRMETSGSVWMPFVLHASSALRRGGRMALVLPFDFTYVKYARPLWKYLGSTFGGLRVVRVRERLFPDILQQVVLLLADDYGGNTRRVTYQAFESVEDVLANRPVVDEQILVERLVAGEREFLRAHVPPRATELLARLGPRLRQVKDEVAFNIGYVCGHKEFFHPSPVARRDYALPEPSLLPTISSSRMLSGRGLFTSGLDASDADRLFLPPAEASALSDGEQRYIAHGESQLVHERYKCRVRKPWYVTPFVKRPDLILSVFAERPILSVNDAGYYATNSLLVGFAREGVDPAKFAAGWYTSLTLLYLEIEVHALGGGVLVLIPGETGRLRTFVPDRSPSSSYLRRLDDAIQRGALEAAYQLGDAEVLQAELGLEAADIAAIRAAVDTLVLWRNSSHDAEQTYGDADDVEVDCS